MSRSLPWLSWLAVLLLAQGADAQEAGPPAAADTTLVLYRWAAVGGGRPSGREQEELRCQIRGAEAVLVRVRHERDDRAGARSTTAVRERLELAPALRDELLRVLGDPATFRLQIDPEAGDGRHFDGAHGGSLFLRQGLEVWASGDRLGCAYGLAPGPAAEALLRMLESLAACPVEAAEPGSADFASPYLVDSEANRRRQIGAAEFTPEAWLDAWRRETGGGDPATFVFLNHPEFLRDWLVFTLSRSGPGPLVQALASAAPDVRSEAISLLRDRFGTIRGYQADGVESERRAAIAAWSRFVLAHTAEGRRRREAEARAAEEARRRAALPDLAPYRWELLAMLAAEADDARTRAVLGRIADDYAERARDECARLRAALERPRRDPSSGR